MKKFNTKLQVLGAVALVAGFASQAKADVDYTVVNSESDLETVSVSDNYGASGSYENVLAGGIQIAEAGTPVAGLPTSYVSLCTDFDASLYLGSTYQYANPVPTSPAPAGYTGDPAWTPTGLQNAATLFAMYNGVLSANPSGQGAQNAAAGLQLAVWTALYDSTGVGAINYTGGIFQVASGTGAYVDMTNYLASIEGNPNSISVDIMLPNPDTANNSNPANPDGEPPQGLLIVTPVPEASTVVTSTLLLLSFGVCSLKSFGKFRS